MRTAHRESQDLVERIGRVYDAFEKSGAQVLAIQVSQEAQTELQRLMRTRNLRALKVGSLELPIEVVPKMIGESAFVLRTASGFIDETLALARWSATRSVSA